MARDALAPVAFVTETPLLLDEEDGLAVDTTDSADGVTIPALGNTRRLLLAFRNDDAGEERTATIKAPTNNPSAPRSAHGDLVVTVPEDGGIVFVTIESARFAQLSGAIEIDFEYTAAVAEGEGGDPPAVLESGYDGFVWAYRLPQGF
jgi:hypothetical protein